MARVGLVLADDDEGILHRLRGLLEKDYELLAAVGDGRSAVEAVDRCKPDLVILDISMPQLNGIEAVRQIKKANPKVKAIILTIHESRAYVEQAMAAGCSGYVLKSSFGREMRTAIETALEGRIYVTPSLLPAR